MTLHISEIRPPDAERIRQARIVDAALAEAGYPHATVSVTDQVIGVGVHLDGTAGRFSPSSELVDRAFQVAGLEYAEWIDPAEIGQHSGGAE